MAEIDTAMFTNEQVEIASSKETLFAQQRLLQKLYNELEVERESSAIAASEALSMILRLQGEKGAVKMEAEQYKRLTKEKMCHAEEILSVFEQRIYQREMEVAALDYQVQAYRYKLLSIGGTDPMIGAVKFPENLLQRNESLVGDTSVHSLGRRNSAPTFRLNYSYQKKAIIDRENSTSLERDLISKIVEEQSGNEVINESSGSVVGTVGINTYWEQISKLDDLVKEIAGANYGSLRSETSSPIPLSQFGSRSSSEIMRVVSMNNEMEQVQHLRVSSSEKEMYSTNPTCYPGVLDVFEVPKVDRNRNDDGKMLLPSDDRLERPNSVPQEAFISDKNKTKRLKKFLKPSKEKILRRTSDIGDNGVCLEFVYPPMSIARYHQPNFNELNRPSEMVEIEAESNGRGEKLKLLNEIKSQLNAIQSEISSLKTKRSPSRDKQGLVSFMEVSLLEAMLHFWL